MSDIILNHFLNEQQRVDNAMKEIQSILTKYNCEMVPVFHLFPGGMKSEVQIRVLMNKKGLV